MNLLRITTLMIAAVIGCSRQNDPSVNSKTVTDEQSDITTMDPNDILFTTPTLNNAIPSTLEESTVPSDCIQFHEDNWRQFEFIAASLKREVDAELADIRVIWDKNSVPLSDSGTAFREIHVRKRIPNPLKISMSLAEFETLVGQKTGPMTLFDFDEVLRDVHAVRIDNLVVYALIQDGHVTTIGIDAMDQFTLPDGFRHRIRNFLQQHNVMLVHWPSRTLFKTTEDIMKYLGDKG